LPIELNALETARFGIRAAHVIDPDATPERLNAAARSLDVKMLSIRVECSAHARIHALEADGHRLMDTLVYYERSLTNALPNGAPCRGVAVRRAISEDASAVAGVARAAFREYVGHFHSDPRLDSAAADAAYVEWAETSIAGLSETAPALVAEVEEAIAGFLTLRRNSPEEIEIVLNAVAPEAQGRGIYGQLVSQALVEGRRMGGARMIVSTQLDNFNVQRAWVTRGFRLYRSVHTFHKWYDPSFTRP
jgi:ribosomal protein S18 acetylase RimI-like enzyme